MSKNHKNIEGKLRELKGKKSFEDRLRELNTRSYERYSVEDNIRELKEKYVHKIKEKEELNRFNEACKVLYGDEKHATFLHDIYNRIKWFDGCLGAEAKYANENIKYHVTLHKVNFDKSSSKNWIEYNEAVFKELDVTVECIEKNLAELKKVKYGGEIVQRRSIESIKSCEKILEDELKKDIKELYNNYQQKLKQLS